MRLVPCSQILEDLQESWVAPTFWLRFNSWTAATTAYTASKSSADESCVSRGREGEYFVSIEDTQSCNNWECNMSAVSGQWGFNPSLEWQPDYSIRSLGRVWSADDVENCLPSHLLSERFCPFLLSSQMKLALPDHSNYCLLSWGPKSSRQDNFHLIPSLQTAASSLPLHPAMQIIH